ncbi:cuticle protein 10.9-like [Tropilaelaps mercedesae]|uniref:Cuticle protein 10.9-like n=1 Tax=Tropilaelaps mercedesae TaxID=418985 RepID=A0A1V9XFT8_9ACAR|nr:cuticle protein 10.9-like [Tropilaelaps mercedesae]
MGEGALSVFGKGSSTGGQRPFLLVALYTAISYGAYQQPGVQDDYEDNNFVSGGYGGPGRGVGGHHARGGSSYDDGGSLGGAGPHGGPGDGSEVDAHHGGGGDDYGVAEKWKPYSFSYTANDPEGSHSHQQQADSKNRVTGQYSIMMADGRMRIVKYVADENGFRAEIVTNEQGTESKNPADVTIQSTAPTGEETAKQFGGAHSNSRYDRYSQTSQQSNHHQDGQGLIDTAGPDHYGAHHGGGPDSNSYPNQQAGAHSGSGYDQSGPGSYSDSHHGNQRYSHHDVQGSFAKDQGNFQTPTYSGHSTTGFSQQGYSQSAPAVYGGGSGSYENDIADLEDDGPAHHTDTGYYSGTGSRSYEGSKSSRQRNKASYG